MAIWLHDSKGDPVAFIHGENVFRKNGRFLGRLDGVDIWDGAYKGEIVNENRILYKTSRGGVNRGSRGNPGSPGVPGMSGSKGTMTMPTGFKDIDD